MPPTTRGLIVERLRAAGCVFAEDEARLLLAEGRRGDELTAMVDRRVAGIPLEQVLGWAEFCGLRIALDPGVFVPRRRSQLLVRQAVRLGRPSAVVVDLCCGSGAVGAAVAVALDRVELHAVDVDPAAVRCAARNLGPGGVAAGRVHLGDLYEPLPPDLRGRVDLLVANAPYVPSAELGLLPAEARLHEAVVALDGGPDGLDVARRVIAAAPSWLAPGGSVLVETSERQVPALLAAFAETALVPRAARSARLSATVVIARSSAHPGADPPFHHEGEERDRPGDQEQRGA